MTSSWSHVTQITIWYINQPHHGHTKVHVMVKSNILTFLLPHDNRPSCSWDSGISQIYLQTSRSRSWVWSKFKVIYWSQYLTDLLPFRFTSIRQTIPEIQLFRNLTMKSVKVMGEVKGRGQIIHLVSKRCTSFPSHFNRTNHSWDMVNRFFDLEKKFWRKKISQIKRLHQNGPKIQSCIHFKVGYGCLVLCCNIIAIIIVYCFCIATVVVL